MLPQLVVHGTLLTVQKLELDRVKILGTVTSTAAARSASRLTSHVSAQKSCASFTHSTLQGMDAISIAARPWQVCW